MRTESPFANKKNPELGEAQVNALYEIAHSIAYLARAVDRLGTAEAATPMGAIEVLALAVKEAGDAIAMSRL